MTHFWTFLTKKPSILFHAPAQPREGFICVYFLSHRVAPYITKDSIKIHDSLMNIFDQKKSFVLRKIYDSFLDIFD